MKKKTKKRLLLGGGLLLLLCMIVPHICSVDLHWDGIGTLPNLSLPAKLPKGAKEIQEKISPLIAGNITGLAIAGILVGAVLWLKKHTKIASRKIRRLAVLCSVGSMPLHELMHGLACPAGSEVHFGIVPQKLIAYAVTNAPMNLAQFTAYMGLPAALLGVLPLIGAASLRRRKKDAATFLFIFGMFGLAQTAPDWFGLGNVLRHAPLDAIVQISNGITYWYTR